MNNKQQYSSADFDKTPTQIQVNIPEKLIHKDVEKTGQKSAYSNERKHPVAFVDLPSKTINMTIGGLIPGGTSNKHRHSYETVLFVLEGEGHSEINGKKVEWQEGDAVYIPVWAWHQHFNHSKTNSAKYLACENAALLQNLGNLAIREEI